MNERRQVAFMECRNDDCKGEEPRTNDSGNYEWFIYEDDNQAEAALCPVCRQPGSQYPY